jgi:membrane protein
VEKLASTGKLINHRHGAWSVGSGRARPARSIGPSGGSREINQRNRKMKFSLERLSSAFHLGGLSAREAARRTWTRINDHEIWTRAAAITFYAIAALVPFMALIISLTVRSLPWIMREIGVRQSQSAGEPTDLLRDLLPADALSLIVGELNRLREQPPTGLISFGLVALLWLSSSVFVGIIDAMNVIRGVAETRPFWKRRLIAMLMTMSQAAILIVSFGTFLAWPQILEWLGLSHRAAILATLIHGFTVWIMVLLSFAIALYFGPDATLRWEWITPGSLLGTFSLFGFSLLFRIYVQRWGDYSATYGSLAGIVVLMSWLWLCAVELLVAAEFNKVVEDAARQSGLHHHERAPAHSAALG